MNRYSSSVHKSDWECSSKSVRGLFFVNPLYIKNLTNLTNLTTLQTLQPYRQCVDTFLFCAACTGGGAFFRATCTGFKLEKWHFPTTEWLVPLGPEPIRDLEWKPWEPSKIKRTHRSRSFLLPRRRSQSIQRFTVTQSTARFAGPAIGSHPGDAASRRRWTPQHCHTVESLGSAGLPGLRRF